MERNEESIETPQKIREEPPKTLTQLYMINRQQMLECVGEYEYYTHLFESIKIGYAIIGNTNKELSKKISDAIYDKDNYPGKRNMNYTTDHVYECSSGTGNSGIVSVRPEDLKVGEESLRNQQAGNIIRNLMPIDELIFNELIERKWIRRETIEDELTRDLMDGA
jgi:hypothetical protein